MGTLAYYECLGDAAIVILCRTICANRKDLNDLNWDAGRWMSLINSEHEFVAWLIKSPSEERKLRDSIPVTLSVMRRLEDAWKIDPEATVLNFQYILDEAAAAKDDLDLGYFPMPRVLQRYIDGIEYQNIFAPLLKHEADYEKSVKESHGLADLEVDWEFGLSKKLQARFELPSGDVADRLKVSVGDELIIRAQNAADSGFKAAGNVVFVDNVSNRVCLQLDRRMPKNPEGKFSLDFVWKSAGYERMQKALKDFALKNCMAQEIFRCILDGSTPLISGEAARRTRLPEHFSVPNLPALNRSQVGAVENALLRPVTLIQGPPGTGKTLTSATIVYHLVKTTMSSGPVLICAPSNTAVDHLAEKVSSAGLKCVRFCARARENVHSNVAHLSLHELIKDAKRFPELAKLQQLMDETGGELSSGDEVRLNELRRKAEEKVLAEAEVICCTCVSSGAPRIARMKPFGALLIDEAMQATEPETLLPIVLGVRQLILVGDHCQLGPVVLSKRVEQGTVDSA